MITATRSLLLHRLEHTVIFLRSTPYLSTTPQYLARAHPFPSVSPSIPRASALLFSTA